MNYLKHFWSVFSLNLSSNLFPSANTMLSFSHHPVIQPSAVCFWSHTMMQNDERVWLERQIAWERPQREVSQRRIAARANKGRHVGFVVYTC